MDLSTAAKFFSNFGRREVPLVGAVIATVWLTAQYAKLNDISSTSKILLFLICLGIAFAVAIAARRAIQRDEDSEANTGNLGAFVMELKNKTRGELDQHIEDNGIAAPPARYNKDEVIFHIIEGTRCDVVCPNRAVADSDSQYNRITSFSVALFSALAVGVALVFLLNLTIFQSGEKRLSASQRKVILAYYEGINRGIQDKDVTGWEQAWKQCTQERQQRFLRGHPSYTDHRVFSLTYKDSGIHNVMYVSNGQRISESEYVYTVVYEERKGVFANPIYFMVWPQTESRIPDLLLKFPDSDSVTNYLSTELEKYYQMRSNDPAYGEKTEAELRQFVRDALTDLYVNRALDPDLFSNVAARFGLLEQPASTSDPIDANKKYFFVRYVYRIEVVRESQESGKPAWKIRKFAPQGKFLSKVNP